VQDTVFLDDKEADIKATGINPEIRRNAMKNQNEENYVFQQMTASICRYIKDIKDTDEKIDTLNYVRSMLHEVSPMKHHPVDFVAWERSENIEGNDYNPNSVFFLKITSTLARDRINSTLDVGNTNGSGFNSDPP
jgi:hypothetical protein